MRKTARYKSLPHNPLLKEFAKELRKAGFLHEVLMWQQLKAKRFKGMDFNRQKIIGNYIADFYCAEKDVVIELDGPSHNGRERYDAERDAYLRSLGLTVIRIKVRDVFRDMERVMAFLEGHPALSKAPPKKP